MVFFPPFDLVPHSFMNIVEKNLCNDLDGSDSYGKEYFFCEEINDQHGCEGRNNAPGDGFEHTSRVIYDIDPAVRFWHILILSSIIQINNEIATKFMVTWAPFGIIL